MPTVWRTVAGSLPDSIQTHCLGPEAGVDICLLSRLTREIEKLVRVVNVVKIEVCLFAHLDLNVISEAAAFVRDAETHVLRPTSLAERLQALGLPQNPKTYLSTCRTAVSRTVYETGSELLEVAKTRYREARTALARADVEAERL